MSRNFISSTGITKIVSTKNQHIQKFEFHTILCDHGATAIGECLKKSEVLQELNMSAKEVTSCI